MTSTRPPAPRFQIAKAVLAAALESGDRDTANIARRSMTAYLAGKRDAAADRTLTAFYAAM